MRTKINMMLARDYVSEWTAADAFRELVANAIDADPDYICNIDGDEVELTTSTEPSLTELILMGAGSKTTGSGTIGQFGEGAKLAALVLTRGRHELAIATTRGLLTFNLLTARHFDRQTLHVTVDDSKKLDEGCRITFRAAGIAEVYRTRFLPRWERDTYGAIPKKNGQKGCKVYCRGILVKVIKEQSLYNWNFHELKLNRDRNVPDLWDVKYRLARLLEEAIVADESGALARQILANPNSLESVCWETIYPSEKAKAAMANAFRVSYGDRAVLSSGNAGQHNAHAAARGFDVVAVPSSIANMVNEGGVARAAEVCLKSDDFNQVSSEPYREELAELTSVLDVLGIAAESFHVFDGKEDTLGAYDRHGIWLNVDLFTPGKRFERIRTTLHELGHAKGGGDESREFENSLDWIAGKLAEKLLDERAARAPHNPQDSERELAGEWFKLSDLLKATRYGD